MNRFKYIHIYDVCLLIFRHVLLFNFLRQLLLFFPTELLLQSVIMQIYAELGANVQLCVERAIV